MLRDDYEIFIEGVRRVCGIDLSSYKRPQMERRIRSFVDHQKIPSLEAYLKLLQGDSTALDKFLDRVTINVSELFRNPEQYQTLRTRVLPELPSGGKVKIWSAGCSYGAEAYTLACLALENYGPGVRTQIVGTDIDRRVVARAQRGRFSRDDGRSVPKATLARFFGDEGDGYQATPELQRLCSFRTGDLLRDRYEQGFDLILCRNVVIYFTEATRNQVHTNLAKALRPGGYLMVGATERVTNPGEMGLELKYPFIYRKVA
jgi:chemotaxis protein methyltransferase CheR